MKTGLIAFAALALSSSFSYAADISGVWRTVDDKTGVVRSHMQMEQQADGSYIGTIIEVFPAPGETRLLKYANLNFSTY